jgi:hypothetical protein
LAKVLSALVETVNRIILPVAGLSNLLLCKLEKTWRFTWRLLWLTVQPEEVF